MSQAQRGEGLYTIHDPMPSRVVQLEQALRRIAIETSEPETAAIATDALGAGDGPDEWKRIGDVRLPESSSAGRIWNGMAARRSSR